MRTRGNKGKHGETDREILNIVLDSLPDHPMGLTKKQIYEILEERTGKDREGIKRRISFLTKSLKDVFVCRVISGKNTFGFKISNLYDLSKLYIAAIEDKDDSPNQIYEFFSNEMKNHFSDIVDYLRLFYVDSEWLISKKDVGLVKDYGDYSDYGLPKEVLDWFIGGPCPNPKWEEPLKEDVSVISNESNINMGVTESKAKNSMLSELPHGKKERYWNVNPEIITFNPDDYPESGIYKIKKKLDEISEYLLDFGYLDKMVHYLPLVSEFHDGLEKYFNEDGNWFFPHIPRYVTESYFFSNAKIEYSNVIPREVMGKFYGFINIFKTAIQNEDYLDQYSNMLPLGDTNSFLRLKKEGSKTLWECVRYIPVESKAENKD